MKKQLFLFIIPLLLTCCTQPQPEQLIPVKEPLEELQTSTPEVKETGSLWQASNGSMFSDQKAHNIGDIVTIIISEQASASKKATTSTSRDSNMAAGISNFFGLENDKLWASAHDPIDISNLVNATSSNTFSGNGTTSRDEKLEAYLTTQVVGVYPNGQLKIRGGKEVMVNNEMQIIYLTGIIRPVDITAANTVNSSKILNARISYTGKGAVSDKQSPGWAMRFLDNIWPF
jgi:flagellar L-ring protein precursor FlgH